MAKGGSVRIYNGQFRSIKGLDRLQKLIASLPESVVRDVKPAIDQGAEDIAARVRSIAPVSDEEVTPGALRDSVHTEAGDHDLSRVVMVDARDQDGKYFAKHVEHGHRTKSGEHVAAVPFFYPALRVSRKKVRRRIARAISKAVKGAQT